MKRKTTPRPLGSRNKNARGIRIPAAEGSEIPASEGAFDPLGLQVDWLVRAIDELEAQLPHKIDVRASGSAQERDLGTLGYLRTFVVELVKRVTCFLEHPGQRLTHASRDDDLQVARVDVLANGEVMVSCHPVNGDELLLLPLSELWPAGPVSDASRVIVRGMARAIMEDAVAKMGLVVARLDEDARGVDHLSAHPAYVVGEDGSCVPDEEK